MNIKCPKCGHILNEVIEEYHSISTYNYSDQYKVKNVKEEYTIRCPYCNSPLPNDLRDKIASLLPRV